MDVLWNVTARRATGTRFSWLLQCAGLAALVAPIGGCDADGEAPEQQEAVGKDEGADSGGGEPMGCEAPLGAGACADVTICDVFECGGKDAPYNHFGCPRTTCEANADCGAEERCFAVALETGCRAETGACADADGVCACEGATSCAGVVEAHCLPTGFYPASEDCEVAALDCAALDVRLDGLQAALGAFTESSQQQLLGELEVCRDRVVEAQATCAGQVAP